MNSGVSIIICCYNSALRLPDTLKFIALQKVSNEIAWEIVIVNNNSSDNTLETINKEWEKYNCNAIINIVDQPIPGLSFAREKGIATAKYEYLLFCDDDNWLCNSFVEDVFGIMSKNKQIGVLGSYGEPYFEKKPSKFNLKYASLYATGKQGDGTNETQYPQVYGACCTYRKSAVISLFENDFTYKLSGRNGSKLDCGEDHELCYAIYLSGYRIWYSDRLKFKHFIPENRMSLDYLKKNIIGISRSKFILSTYQLVITNRSGYRPEFKNSLIWILTLRVIFLIKKVGRNIINLEINEITKTELIAEINSLVYFIINRDIFKQFYLEFTNSKWIKK